MPIIVWLFEWDAAGKVMGEDTPGGKRRAELVWTSIGFGASDDVRHHLILTNTAVNVGKTRKISVEILETTHNTLAY